MLDQTPEELFWPAGLMSWWPASNSVDLAQKIVYVSRYLLITLWTCSAIGLGGRLPRLMTGLLLFIHWGLFKAASGTSHTWHLPLFSLFILGMLTQPCSWSVDAWLSRRYSHYPFRVHDPNHWDSFAIKLILLCCAFVMFAGGVAKIRWGGSDWLSGETLHQYLIEMPVIKGEVGKSLHDFLIGHPWSVQILSVWTILLELSAPLILFIPGFRKYYVLNAWAFHLGIFMLMSPRYFPQMTVYLLWFNLFVGPDHSNQQQSKTGSTNRTLKRDMILAFSTFFSLLSNFTWVIFVEREFFPLTHVPMYSNRLTSERIGDFPKAKLRTFPGYRQAARQYLKNEQPWFLYIYTKNNRGGRMEWGAMDKHGA